MAIRQKDYLYHHGIKDMKWGVRRTPEQLGHRVGEGRVKGLFKDPKPKKLPKGIIKPIVENPDYMPGENSNSAVTDDEREDIRRTLIQKARELESGAGGKQLKQLRADMEKAQQDCVEADKKLNNLAEELYPANSSKRSGMLSNFRDTWASANLTRRGEKKALDRARKKREEQDRARQEKLDRNPAYAQAKKELEEKRAVAYEKIDRYSDEQAGSVLKSLGIENSKEMRDFVRREGLLYDDDQDFD